MEFFRTVNIQTSESELKERINIESIPEINPDIILLGGNENHFQIGSIWGEFYIRRDDITGGVRFSMLNCPNALTWTITTGYPPKRDQIIIHITIKRQQKPAKFVEKINEFLERGCLNHFGTTAPSVEAFH